MTKEIEGVSPEEWAKALEDARNTLELRDAGIIIESDYLCARALIAAQAEIERLTNEVLSYRDLADEQSGKVHDIRTLAEGMAGALETANHILWARLNDTDPVVDSAHRQIAAGRPPTASRMMNRRLNVGAPSRS